MSDDDTTTFELTRRRILGGALTIGAASAATGAGTLALFSDTEQSSGNTVQAGTLDLTTNDSAGFPFSPDKVAPGEPAGSPKVDLQNSGTTEGDHVEFAASITGEGSEASEPSDSDIDTETSGEAFAKHVFVKSLRYGGSPVNWEGDAFTTLVDDPGAVVFDDMTLDRVSDPAGGGRDGVLRLMGTGYGLSMRSVSGIPLDQIGSGTVTLDWRGGANNKDSAPDEIYAVIEDTGGTRHLVYHTANYDSNNDDDNGQTWRTIDIGTEMGLASGTPYNSNFNWPEIAPNSDNTYADPSNGGLTASASSDNQATASFGGDAVLRAVGAGAGNFGTPKQKEVYYDDLSVEGQSYDLRPLTLYDLAKRGVADNLPGLSVNGENQFSGEFYLDPATGNRFQADGVEMQFEFGLAQESGQDVL